MKNLPIINLFHFFLVAPFLLYIGYAQNYMHTKPPRMIFDILIIVAIIVFAYHGYRIVQKMF